MSGIRRRGRVLASLSGLAIMVGAAATHGVATARHIHASDLVVTQNDNVDPVVPGGTVVYNVTVTNRGPEKARHVVSVFGRLETNDPDGGSGTITNLTSVGSPQAEACSHGPRNWRCSFKRLAVGETAEVRVRVSAPVQPAVISNVASAELTRFVDPDQTNNTNVRETTTVGTTFASKNEAAGTNAGNGGTAGTTGVVNASNRSKSIVRFPVDGTERRYEISEGPPERGVDCIVSPCHGPVTDLTITPSATVNKPFRIKITWDRTTRAGQTLEQMTLYHNEVPVPRCDAGTGARRAIPDPCWKVKRILRNGDIRFVMLSSHNGHIRK